MRGISLIEILLAIALMGITIVGIAEAIFGTTFSLSQMQMEEEALRHARHLLAGTYDIPYENLVSISSTTIGRFTQSLTIEEQEDQGISSARVLVSWQTPFGTQQTISLEARHADPQTSPSSCDGFVEEGWLRPQVRNTYLLQQDGLLGDTVPGGAYSVAAIAATSSMIAVAINSTSIPSTPALFFFKAQGVSLEHLSGFDNASTSRTGFSSVVFGNRFVFAGNRFGSKSSATCNDGVSCAQVQIFETKTKDTVQRVGAISLATTSQPFARTSGGESAGATTLFYQAPYLYLGLEKTNGGQEFSIVDVSDPSQPKWMSGYSVGRTINHITVRDSRAYVSTDDPARELIILDIRDTLHPVLLGSYNAPGAVGFGYGAASLARNSLLRFGRTYSSNASELSLLDVKNPAFIKEVASRDSGISKNPESVRSLASLDTLTFALLTHRLEFWNTNAPNTVSLLAPTHVLPAGTEGAALACRNNLMYLGRNSVDGSGMIDVLSGS